MKKRLIILLIICIMVFVGAYVAQASLITIGTATYNGSDYDLIWEDDNNGNSLVWFNYQRGGYSEEGNYDDMMSWAAGLDSDLDYHIDPAYTVEWEDAAWRLPNVDTSYGDDLSYDGSTSLGFNITTSEYGYLFYEELGLNGSYDTDGNFLGDWWDIRTLPIALSYWNISSQVYDGNENAVWYFDLTEGMPYVGYQGLAMRTPFDEYGWGGCNYAYTTIAVRTATVAPIPEPATMLLLGSGIVGLAGFRRKFRKK